MGEKQASEVIEATQVPKYESNVISTQVESATDVLKDEVLAAEVVSEPIKEGSSIIEAVKEESKVLEENQASKEDPIDDSIKQESTTEVLKEEVEKESTLLEGSQVSKEEVSSAEVSSESPYIEPMIAESKVTETIEVSK